MNGSPRTSRAPLWYPNDEKKTSVLVTLSIDVNIIRFFGLRVEVKVGHLTQPVGSPRKALAPSVFARGICIGVISVAPAREGF